MDEKYRGGVLYRRTDAWGIIEDERSEEVGLKGRSAIYPVCFDVGMDVAFRNGGRKLGGSGYVIITRKYNNNILGR